MSTIKADAVTTKSDNTDLVVSGGGSGVPDIEASFKVGGTAGVPMASIRTTSGTASSSTFLRGDGTWNAAGGGGTAIISRSAFSGSSTVTFTGFDSSLYDAYEFFLHITTSGSTAVNLRTSTDGGSNYDDTSSDYKYAAIVSRSSSGTVDATTSTTATAIPLHTGQNLNTVGQFTFTMIRPDLASQTHIGWTYVGDSGGEQIGSRGSGTRASAADVDAVQISLASQTMTGSITVIGILKA